MVKEARSDGSELISINMQKKKTSIDIGCILNGGLTGTRCLLNWWAQLLKNNFDNSIFEIILFNQG